MYDMYREKVLTLSLQLHYALTALHTRVQSMPIIHCSRNLQSISDHRGLKDEGSHRVTENRNGGVLLFRGRRNKKGWDIRKLEDIRKGEGDMRDK